MLTGAGAALTVLAVRVAHRVQSTLRVFSRLSKRKLDQGACCTAVLLGCVGPSWVKLGARHGELIDQIALCFLSGSERPRDPFMFCPPLLPLCDHQLVVLFVL